MWLVWCRGTCGHLWPLAFAKKVADILESFKVSIVLQYQSSPHWLTEACSQLPCYLWRRLLSMLIHCILLSKCKVTRRAAELSHVRFLSACHGCQNGRKQVRMIAHGSRLSVANSRGKEETKTRQDNVHHLSKTTQTHTHKIQKDLEADSLFLRHMYTYVGFVRKEAQRKTRHTHTHSHTHTCAVYCAYDSDWFSICTTGGM